MGDYAANIAYVEAMAALLVRFIIPSPCPEDLLSARSDLIVDIGVFKGVELTVGATVLLKLLKDRESEELTIERLTRYYVSLPRRLVDTTFAMFANYVASCSDGDPDRDDLQRVRDMAEVLEVSESKAVAVFETFCTLHRKIL